MRKHLIVFPLLVTLLVSGCSTQVPDDATGEEIYLQLCGRCHGNELEGRIGSALGPGSFSASQSDEYLVFTIENGRGRMPSFGSTLDDAQVGVLVDYIRAVQAA